MSRIDIANFVQTLAFVYTLIIIAYILFQLYVNFGGRVPYARWSSALIGFLQDTVLPYLNLFRRFIPQIGPLDISPIVAIFALNIVANVVSNVIAG